MLENVKVLCHSCIKFEDEKVVYFDPFKIDKNYKDADLIMITHSHFDHYSEEDIKKIRKENTKIVAPNDLLDKILENGFAKENVFLVQPNKTYIIDGINVETVPAYNVNKSFHPKENGWVGYIITLHSVCYYIAGDTDITEENKKVNCDVAFVPVGGTYTMIAKEAVSLVNIIKPKIAVPIHYGSIVGTKKDADDFICNLDKDIKGMILIENL